MRCAIAVCSNEEEYSDFDLERMEEALAAPSLVLPVGLPREEKCKLIIRFAQDNGHNDNE